MLSFRLAYPLAETLQKHLAPACEPGKCLIAGSLRRHASAIAAALVEGQEKLAEMHQDALVKDIELVVYPRPGANLFGSPTYERTPLDDLLNDLLAEGTLTWPDDKKDGPRYKKLLVPGTDDRPDVALDLFVCLPPAQWGYQVAIRTGPWQYSRWLVKKRKWGGGMPSHLEVHDAGLYNRRELIPTPTEETFFNALGLLMPPPHARVGDG